ncbi:class I SAM-dependent methyltransferase [Candidatus Azambacteria bacterium]|nr:class I SAM-dependent methyltransferase [Candidatus Azambacteria bacterium]
MKQEYAKKLIEKNRQAYDLISQDFDRTRSYLWEGLKPFSKYAKNGDAVLDFGCGNGRLLNLFAGKNVSYIGIDASDGLINAAKKKFSGNLPEGINGVEFLKVDSLKLPFKDGSFDSVYSIAALHHIPTEKMRLELLSEFQRTLKPEGKMVLTNWNLWQKNYRNLILKYAIKKFFGQSGMDLKDVIVPWKDQKGVVMAERYYHAFTKSELKRIVKRSGSDILEIGYFGGKNNNANIYIIAKKC